MVDYSLTQLRYFCAVAETGSFAGAAEREHLSATAIAASVTALEESFGMTLCTRRRSQGIMLTTSGQLLYREALRLLRDAEELTLTLRGSGTQLVGPLRVGCFPNLSPMIVPQLLQQMKAQHPGVDLDFAIAPLHEMIAEVDEGRLDCLVTYTDLLPERFVRTELYTSSVYALFSLDHPYAQRASVTMDDLRSEPMILYQSRSIRPESVPMFGRHPLDFTIAFRTTQDELARAMIAEGHGFGLTIQRTGTVESPHPRCAMVPVDTPWPQDTVAVCRLGSLRPSPRVIALTRIAQEIARHAA